MELELNNKITNSLENEQNNFLNTNLGNAINNGINIGLRYLLPDYLENQIIDLKDNLLNYGLKDGISKSIQSAITLGKNAIGILTGKFENINQINQAIKVGGIIDSISNLLDDVLNKLKDKGKINNTLTDLIKNGKNSILNNVQKNIESTLNTQDNNSKLIEKYMDNWKDFYNNKNFNGMEKEYKKIKEVLKELVPIEKIINNAKNIQTLHELIKNKGMNFNLTEEEKQLALQFNN